MGVTGYRSTRDSKVKMLIWESLGNSSGFGKLLRDYRESGKEWETLGREKPVEMFPMGLGKSGLTREEMMDACPIDLKAGIQVGREIFGELCCRNRKKSLITAIVK